MMGFQFEKFRAYPRPVKLAAIFLVTGWGVHFLFIHSYFPEIFPFTMIYKQAIIAGLICLFVAMIKRWARMLCIFFNIAMIGIYLLFLQFFFSGQSHYYQDTRYLLLGVVCMASFIAATYFLLTRECNQFFKAYGRAEKEET